MPDAEQATLADAGARPTTVVERPDTALARGRFEFPAWGISAIGLAVLLLALGYAILRWRKRR